MGEELNIMAMVAALGNPNQDVIKLEFCMEMSFERLLLLGAVRRGLISIGQTINRTLGG